MCESFKEELFQKRTCLRGFPTTHGIWIWTCATRLQVLTRRVAISQRLATCTRLHTLPLKPITLPLTSLFSDAIQPYPGRTRLIPTALEWWRIWLTCALTCTLTTILMRLPSHSSSSPLQAHRCIKANFEERSRIGKTFHLGGIHRHPLRNNCTLLHKPF